MIKVFLLLLCLAYVPFIFCAPLSLPPCNVNFSGCTLKEHKEISGSLTAHSAVLTSATITGETSLSHSTIENQLTTNGDTECKHCTIGSMVNQGPAALYFTTITRELNNSGEFECGYCTIGTFKNTGVATLNATEVTGNIESTGRKLRASDSKFANLTHEGTFKGKNISCTNLSLTGNTILTSSTIHKTATFNGPSKCTECIFNTLSTQGRTRLQICNINEATIIGDLEAQDISCKICTVMTETATFTNCSINTLYVQANSKGKTPIITIKGLKGLPSNTIIKKIICQDPNTQIVYSSNANKANYIIGTENITSI